MEDKNNVVYIILFILVIVVLFLLTRLDKESGTAINQESKAQLDPNGNDDGYPEDAGSNVKSENRSRNRHMVVYINWDGFAWYYYDLANYGESSGTPVISGLAKQGVLFSDVSSGIPSITNPMQTSILSGAWPSVTGNCYQYYDRESKKMVKTGRDNRAENLAETVSRQGYNAVSIHQFILENRGTYADSTENPYIQLGNNADYNKRFNEAIRYIKGLENVKNLPAFLAVYMDDLDGIGHNDWFTYGVAPVKTESERIRCVLKRLGQMDAKLGELIQACKSAGIYDDVSFLLTSDHGMTPYGIQNRQDDGYGYSKLPDLISELKVLGYKAEALAEGKSTKEDTDIVLAPTGLQVQLFFTGSYDEIKAGKITETLLKKEYIGIVMDKRELDLSGSAEEFADMLISPKPPYCFKNDKWRHMAGGQHDSLDESSQHVFALMWGKGIKKGLDYRDHVYVTDFAKTISSLLGIGSPKDATGQLLDKILE